MELLKLLEITNHLITVFGVPAAIYVFLREQKLMRREREYGTYDALDNKYIELQQLCLQHPELDVFDTPYESPPHLTPEQKKQEEAICLIRLSIFERAYLMYKRSSLSNRKEQWDGWNTEIREWFERPNFVRCWKEHSPYFDSDFVKEYGHLSNG